MNEKIDEFFERYQKFFNKALKEATEIDAKEMAQCFSDCFIAANPAGVACGKNDEELKSQILRGLQFYRSMGTRSMKCVGDCRHCSGPVSCPGQGSLAVPIQEERWRGRKDRF